MANPAIQRSGDGEDDPGGGKRRDGTHAAGAYATHTTADLIALRDELLAEYLDLENRLAQSGGRAGETSIDPGIVRTKIDEIHQELAFRDLTERTAGEYGRHAAEAAPPGESAAPETGIAAEVVRKSAEILKTIEMRSRFMDELAQAAWEQGHLDQAAAFTLNAQKFDLERVEVLRQLSALSAKRANTDD